MNKEQIIQAAVDLANENGWEKASIRNISKRINYSTIKIYSEFGNKDNLLTAIQKRGFNMLRQAMISAMEHKESPKDKFIALNLAYYNFTKTNPAHYSLMFQMDGTNCPKVDGALLQHTSQPIRALIGELSGEPITKSQFFNWWALMHGYVAITQGYSPSNSEEYFTILQDMIKRFIYSLRYED
ncbi:MAG: TetR/AcrR family transcriptional regulator [Bacteroidota bacterium]